MLADTETRLKNGRGDQSTSGQHAEVITKLFGALVVVNKAAMRCQTPEISWHALEPILSVDVHASGMLLEVIRS